MAVVQIRNIAYIVKFLDKFMEEKRVTAWSGRDRYLAEYSVEGRNVRLVGNYSENTVTVWFDPSLLKSILSEALLYDEYLRKAVFIGSVALPVKGKSKGFIKASWGRVEVLKVTRGLWLGSDGYLTFFASNLEGLVELVELLEGSS
ncbi:hypothetical protein [Thermococcus stetteri]|uniref:hypothetical protein n=1 Tax=Thermococcus stetteri TaxID=49900 RepID=UPI001AE3EEB3|nr:hypothetical protein [Thermococcus stetteri]MBP1911856.1 hypothetical protein [Thermococcus stetteri]